MIRPAYHTDVPHKESEIVRRVWSFLVLCTVSVAISFPSISTAEEPVDLSVPASPKAEASHVGATVSAVPFELGTHPDALLYRQPFGAAEGVVFLSGSADVGTVLVAEWFDEGMTVLVLPEQTSPDAMLSWARSGFSALQNELGVGAEIAVVGVGPTASVALRVAEERGAGASILIDPRAPLAPTRSTPALVLIDETEVTAVEYGRDLYLDSEDRGALWLFDLSGAKWSELLSRSDLALDLATWTSEMLDRTRAARSVPVAGGAQ